MPDPERIAGGDGWAAVRCSFCGKSGDDVPKIIAGAGVYICSECIVLCVTILAEETPREAGGATGGPALRFAARQPDGGVAEWTYLQPAGAADPMYFELCWSCGTWNFGAVDPDAVRSCLHCGADIAPKSLRGLRLGDARYTERARATIAGAQDRAARLGAPAVAARHVLGEILGQGVDSPALRALRRAGVDLDRLRRLAESGPAPAADAGRDPRSPAFDPAATDLLCKDAPAFARTLGHARVGPEHVLLALHLHPETAALLEAAGAGPEALRAAVAGSPGAT